MTANWCHVRHPMEGLPHQHFADLHDRLNIGIVRRVPLELGGVWSKSGCEHLSGVGIGGTTPRSPAAFVAMVHATFDSAEVFATAFAPHAAEFQGDAPNYTDIQPVVQISEVLMG